MFDEKTNQGAKICVELLKKTISVCCGEVRSEREKGFSMRSAHQVLMMMMGNIVPMRARVRGEGNFVNVDSALYIDLRKVVPRNGGCSDVDLR